MSSDLIPPEIMDNILLRLRVKDLVNCRRVSKRWLSIIDDPKFIRTQLHRSLSANSNFALFRQQRTSEPTVLYSSDDINSTSFSNPIHCDPKSAWLMGSCHGLVCFSLSDRPYPDFVIVNPSTGERRTLNNPNIKEGRIGDELKAGGFGYDESSDDYKVVRILHTNGSHIAEIYGVRSEGFFRTIPLPRTADWDYCNRMFVGVFFGSSLHLYIQRSDNTVAPDAVIHAIDLSSNTYHQLRLPQIDFGGYSFLNIGIVDRRMCLCGFLNAERKYGIWIMEEYGNPESWNRIYSFQNVFDLRDPFSVNRMPYAATPMGSNGDKILLMISWRDFVWYDPTKKNADDETDESICLLSDTKNPFKLHHAVYCLESLVKIFPNAYDKQLTKHMIDGLTTLPMKIEE